MPLKNEAAVFCISKAGSDEAGAGFVVHCSPPYSWLCTCRHAIEEICGDKNPRESLHLIRVQECNPVDLFMDETGFPEDLALLKFENFPETPCWPLALQDAEEGPAEVRVTEHWINIYNQNYLTGSFAYGGLTRHTSSAAVAESYKLTIDSDSKLPDLGGANYYDLSSYIRVPAVMEQYAHSRAGVHPVGKKQPNTWGLYDMIGNVLEWCEDRYGDYPSGIVVDQIGPSSGSDRVLRGGSWSGFAKLCRSAARLRGRPFER